ncbi:MAG: tRNA ((37)-N6)-threonylcarbamoyltransferase complex ATPase subunit type 1 TsaE [Verrucomicrobiales bacterium]|nr:tRNA ((37)-N6)-threonylcarbamoyltransferase complex ATPase subunit type 1 TsaE [Verrucomicrobiales bacterium]
MATHISHSASETEALGEQWGREANAGLVIGLSGDLGTGKTQLTKGIARGLGVNERILSPTFALVNEYRSGRLPMFHLDLYRLDTRAQIVGAGLEQYLTRPKGVAIVEWIERWLEGNDVVGARYRRVQIKQLSETDREIIYEDFGG